MNSGIYKITHKDTGRIYIGQSIDFKRRITCHRNPRKNRKYSTCIENAVKKYGWDAFDFSVLVYAKDRDYLNILEIKAIEVFNCMSPIGFNLRTGGNDSAFSDETRSKMSQIRTLYLKNPDVIANLRAKRALQVISKESYEQAAAHHRGSKWMNNGEKSKKVRPDMVEQHLTEGYLLGRITTYITDEFRLNQSKNAFIQWNRVKS